MPTPDTCAKRRRAIVEQIKRSDVYREYEKAFRQATGLPFNLRAIESFDLPLRDDPKENPFCALMARANQSCSACLQLQQRLTKQAGHEPMTLQCFAGLCDSAVPVRVGGETVAFLQTGQILLHPPRPSEFEKLTRTLDNWGVETDTTRLEEAYFQTRVFEKKQYEAILRLLGIFAQHLSTISNRLLTLVDRVESPPVARAKLYISQHLHERLTLREVAGAVNTSTFYFCKVFKQTTGLTFTDYVARLRVEKSKSLLLDPHKRISEAAFEAGFQSLSQFNRVFRRVTGQAPTVWRSLLGRN